jgi:D-amino peptidase
MNLLIIADMEGVAGIAHKDECDPDSPEYVMGVRLLNDEVNVLARAALTSGATSVSVIDWHLGGGNLKTHLLDDRVQIAAEDLSVGYDAVVLSGFHAMRGDTRGFISHTMYSERGVTVEIDGTPVGELWLLSRWAGDHDIPIVLVSGDTAAILEAAKDLPETSGVPVKTARSYSEADVVPADEAHSLLASEVRRQLLAKDALRCYAAELPVRFRIGFEGVADLPSDSLRGMRRDQDGRIVGEVQKVRDLIELIDVVGSAPAEQPKGDGDRAA